MFGRRQNSYILLIALSVYCYKFIFCIGKVILVVFCASCGINFSWAYAAQTSIKGEYTDVPGQWKELESGLEFGEFYLEQNNSLLTVLRIDPEKFDFTLCSASNGDNIPKTLRQWATSESLSAAINASMYLPDNRTSTGYMRQGIYINNGKIVNRFGAFFVADPRRPGLPKAAVIDRDQPGWRELLDDYELVIQNYRMINSKGKVLWDSGGPRYAISAVAQDGAGKILFLHSRTPVEAASFAREILSLPLDLRTVMYVEGGAQAGLVVDAGDLQCELWSPHAPSLIVTGNLRAVLPNVLGIRQRKEQNSGKILYKVVN